VLLAKTLRSSTFKLALIAIGTFGVIVSAIFGYVYLSTSAYIRSRSDRAIMAEYMDLRGVYEQSGREGLIALIRQRTADKAFAGHVYILSDPSSAVLAANLREWPPTAVAPSGWTEFRAPGASPEGGGSPLVRGMVNTFPNGVRLLVGQDISDLDRFAGEIKTAVISVVLLIFVLAGVASILVTRRTVGRIEQINATSRAIMASGLDKRIPLRGTHDEWDRVAENLNLMLDRIETLMGEVKQVSDNVAHDLRTPLTRARLSLERGRTNATTLEQLQLVVDKAIAGIDQSLSIVTALLRLAEIENSRRSSAFGDVALGEMLREVCDMYEPIAEDKQIALSVASSGKHVVRGDRDLLVEAVANVLDNAIKFTPPGGSVKLELIRGADETSLRVTDSGPGISNQEQEAVLRRFYRSDKIRNTPGVGLGLNLVSAIAKLHGFRLVIHPGPGGRVEIVCPDEPAGLSG